LNTNQINKLKNKLEIIHQKFKKNTKFEKKNTFFDSHGGLKSYKLPFISGKKEYKIKLSTKRKCKKRRIKRKSLLRYLILRTKFKYQRPKQKKKIRKYRKEHPKVKRAKIFIKFRRINTFLTLHARKDKVSIALTTGALKFKGKSQGKPYARQTLGKIFALKARKEGYRLIDIYYVSKVGRLYRFIVKSFIKKKLVICTIRVRKIHSHGMLRTKKEKRKKRKTSWKHVKKYQIGYLRKRKPKYLRKRFRKKILKKMVIFFKRKLKNK